MNNPIFYDNVFNCNAIHGVNPTQPYPSNAQDKCHHYCKSDQTHLLPDPTLIVFIMAMNTFIIHYINGLSSVVFVFSYRLCCLPFTSCAVLEYLIGGRFFMLSLSFPIVCVVFPSLRVLCWIFLMGGRF